MRDKTISLSSKLKLPHALVLSNFLYGCETWALTTELQRKIQAVEMIYCFRRVLGISYREHITDEQVHASITKHIKHYEELLTTVKKRELRWYGHLTRARGHSKTILQGTVQGGRRKGGQRKKWTYDITEWTEKSFATTQALAHDRQMWR